MMPSIIITPLQRGITTNNDAQPATVECVNHYRTTIMPTALPTDCQNTNTFRSPAWAVCTKTTWSIERKANHFFERILCLTSRGSLLFDRRLPEAAPTCRGQTGCALSYRLTDRTPSGQPSENRRYRRECQIQLPSAIRDKTYRRGGPLFESCLSFSLHASSINDIISFFPTGDHFENQFRRNPNNSFVKRGTILKSGRQAVRMHRTNTRLLASQIVKADFLARPSKRMTTPRLGWPKMNSPIKAIGRQAVSLWRPIVLLLYLMT